LSREIFLVSLGMPSMWQIQEKIGGLSVSDPDVFVAALDHIIEIAPCLLSPVFIQLDPVSGRFTIFLQPPQSEAFTATGIKQTGVMFWKVQERSDPVNH
jgi:hypothetical protein